jgi:hypothetical protein
MDAGEEDFDCPNAAGQARVICPGRGGEITLLIDQCELDVYVKSSLTFSGMTKEQAMAIEHPIKIALGIHVGALPKNVIILGYARRLSLGESLRRLAVWGGPQEYGGDHDVTIDFKVAVSEEDANQVEADLATPSPNALLKTIAAVLYFHEDVVQSFADAGGSILDVTLTINEVDVEDFSSTIAPTPAPTPPRTTPNSTPSSMDAPSTHEWKYEWSANSSSVQAAVQSPVGKTPTTLSTSHLSLLLAVIAVIGLILVLVIYRCLGLQCPCCSPKPATFAPHSAGKVPEGDRTWAKPSPQKVKIICVHP